MESTKNGIKVSTPTIGPFKGQKRYMVRVRRAGIRTATETFASMAEALEFQKDKLKGEPTMARSLATSKLTLGDKYKDGKLTEKGLLTRYIEQRCEESVVSYAIRSMYARLALHPVLNKVIVGDADHNLAKAFCLSRKMGGVTDILGKPLKKASPSAISGEYVRVSMAMREFALDQDWGTFDPWSLSVRKRLTKRGLVAQSNKRKFRTSPEQLEAIKTLARERFANGTTKFPMADIIDVAVRNGFRCEEIMLLRWSDLHRTDKVIYCWDRKDASRQAVVMNDYTGDMEKENDFAIVPLIRGTRDILLRQPRKDNIRLGEPTPGVAPGSRDDLIFGYDGSEKEAVNRKLGHRVGHLWAELCKALDIKNRHFHDLRHEAISTFAPYCTTIRGMHISGHKNAASYLRYVNQTVEDAQQTADLVDQHFPQDVTPLPPNVRSIKKRKAA